MESTALSVIDGDARISCRRLQEMLGNAIAMVGQGDPGAIETLMTGAENLVAEVATEAGEFVAAIREMTRRAQNGDGA